MTKQKPEYILSPGQPSLEERYGEETKRLNITLPLSMYNYLLNRKARGMPASELIRQLVAAHMKANPDITDSR